MENNLPQLDTFEQSFALFDGEGRLLEWDRGFVQEMAGARSLILRGARFADIVRHARSVPPPNGDGQSTPADRRAEEWLADFGTAKNFDYRWNDRILNVREHRTANGGIFRLARDVTAERQRREAYYEAQKQLQAASVAADVFTWIRRNANGELSYPPTVSQGLRHVFGLPDGASDMALALSRMRLTPEERARHIALMDDSARGLDPCHLDLRVRTGHAGSKWLRFSMVPTREPDGGTLWTVAIRDVTLEKVAEDQVELLRSVVVQSSDAILVFDSGREPGVAGSVIYVNPAFERLSGFAASEIVGRPPSMFSAFDDRGAIGAWLIAGAGRDDARAIEFEWTCRDGTQIWVEANFALVQDWDDGPRRWVTILRDIGERRQAQLELLQAKEAAESANQAKGQFLANMSHELRTPLNAIIGFSELIEQGMARDGWSDSYAEYLRDISASGHHLLSLINAILDLSKIESGMIEIEMAPVDLNELTGASMALVSGLARDAGVELRFDRQITHPEIVGDFVKLKQVLINILSNAIKFTPPGGSVTIGMEIAGDAVVISVADTGCGMSEADLQRAVLPFVQLENSLSRRHPGTGLGLSISKQLCEMHNGRFAIESAEGAGTTVRIALPLLVGRMQAVAAAAQSVSGAGR
jgi:PAS domain S-box-containing protein